MNNTQADLKKKIFSLAMTHNLQLIIEFHNEQRKLMYNQVSLIEKRISVCNDRYERKVLLQEKYVFENTFVSFLNTNTFLMMYSQLEEFLYHVWKTFGREQNVGNSGSLERFKPIISEVLGIDLSKDCEWGSLCDYEKVRNCLLHANGRIKILKNEKAKKEIDRIINVSSYYLSIKKDQIELSVKFLEIVSKMIESLIKRVEKVANT
jgi:hypothetical protein